MKKWATAQPLRVLSMMEAIVHAPWPGEMPVMIEYFDDYLERPERLKGVDVLLGQIFSHELAVYADDLRLVQAPGAGVERINFDAIPPGCVVANVFEHERAIAEWVIAAMVMLNRDAVEADRNIRAANWSLSYFRSDFPPELSSQTLGILGLGHIGKQTAAFARAFGMRIVACTRTPPSAAECAELGISRVVRPDALHDVLAESDFVLMTVPASAESDGYIGAAELATMKPTACLINVSRGSLIDEKPLYDALRTRGIKGAALDVWWNEPLLASESPWPATLPFWELDNVLMSPHLSGLTEDMLRRRMVFAGANVDRLVRAEPLQNVVYVGGRVAKSPTASVAN